MSQLNSMAIPMEGKYSKSELLELKNKMNAKALAKRRSKTALRLAANIIFAILILLPLLYAVSIALMPSNELFTTDLNLFPKHPTLQNFKEAFTTVPLLRFILNSFIMAGCITIGQIISCSLAAFAFSFLEFKGKGILFAIVMATMNLIIKGKHKKTLIFPVFSGDSVFNRIHDRLSFWSYNTRSESY